MFTPMVNIHISYEGDLRCSAKHEPSGTVIVTDAPVDNHGKGQSFSPTDLVATALGTCMLTIMGIVAEREKIDLKGTTVSVSKEMTASPPRRIAKLTVRFSIPATLTPEQRQKLENAARTCPVHKSLGAEVQTPIEFSFA